MPKPMLYILIVIVVAGAAGGAYYYLHHPKVLTMADLRAQLARAKQLNAAGDFSLVTSVTEYHEDLGVYNGRAVQFAYRCWGDLCPDNGAFFLRYTDVPKESCAAIGGSVVEGYNGFGGMTYGGCSPIEY